tara:strand:+ start:1995 stop:2912 length:918 start_codon:yes stop_codon:yes gene_type:complete
MSEFNEDIPIKMSSIETIDGAMLDHIRDMNTHVIGNKGFEALPVIWVSAERAFQAKKSKEYRDSDGTIVLPVLTLERTAMQKSLTKKGSVYGNVPPEVQGNSIVFQKRIKQDKTSNFEGARIKRSKGQINFPSPPEKTVYQFAYAPMPVYLYITYQVTIRTQYIQQMNQALLPFLNKGGGINYFSISKDGHRYEAFLQEDFAPQNNLSSMGTDERTIETQFNINVLGYILGSEENQEGPKVSFRESIVDIAFTKEESIFGDIPQNISAADLLAAEGHKTDKTTNPGVGKYPDGWNPNLPEEDPYS